MITISGHTILALPQPGDNVLDVGSHNYGFANPCAKAGANVYCVEPDTDAPPSPHPYITLIRKAVYPVERTRNARLVKWSNGEGNHLDIVPGDRPKGATFQETPLISLQQLSVQWDVPLWDIIKLDCEGAEYPILLDLPGPIAKQITVEFHDFCSANPGGEKTHAAILAHIGQWYDIVQHEKTVVNTWSNYWDSLFVLKGTHVQVRRQGALVSQDTAGPVGDSSSFV